MKAWEAIISSFAKRQLPSFFKKKNLGLILTKKNGFEAELKGDRQKVEFDKICKITAFKWDMLTTDLICLEIESDQRVCIVNEDMEGFTELCKVLHKILPNIREDLVHLL
jgi:hypothetical protein